MKMNLGESEFFEIWIVFHDNEDYEDCILNVAKTLEDAYSYGEWFKSETETTTSKFTIEFVRVATIRSRIC